MFQIYFEIWSVKKRLLSPTSLCDLIVIWSYCIKIFTSLKSLFKMQFINIFLEESMGFIIWLMNKNFVAHLKIGVAFSRLWRLFLCIKSKSFTLYLHRYGRWDRSVLICDIYSYCIHLHVGTRVFGCLSADWLIWLPRMWLTAGIMSFMLGKWGYCLSHYTSVNVMYKEVTKSWQNWI